ncbi:MAG: hypothetical protein AAGD17_07085 [Bacteroidota bacterium]
MKGRILYLVIGAFVVGSGILLSKYYRPYVYSNNIYDFGFADTIGSLVSVIGFCFFLWAIKAYSRTKKNQHIMLALIIYGPIWELQGILGIHGTFDWKDFVGVFISALITYFLKELIETRIESKKID